MFKAVSLLAGVLKAGVVNTRSSFDGESRPSAIERMDDIGQVRSGGWLSGLGVAARRAVAVTRFGGRTG